MVEGTDTKKTMKDYNFEMIEFFPASFNVIYIHCVQYHIQVQSTVHDITPSATYQRKWLLFSTKVTK